jgi:hypothetical protein
LTALAVGVRCGAASAQREGTLLLRPVVEASYLMIGTVLQL